MTDRYPWGKGTPKWTYDATANDSDKSFTVPTGKKWDLLSVYGQMLTTATVGNRLLTISISNGTATVWISRGSGNIAAATLGGVEVMFGGTLTSSTTVKRILADNNNLGVFMQDCGPRAILPAGYIVKVWDAAAIDAAADDLTVVLHYIEYDA